MDDITTVIEEDFLERGSRALKGVEGEWRLFAATRGGDERQDSIEALSLVEIETRRIALRSIPIRLSDTRSIFARSRPHVSAMRSFI